MRPNEALQRTWTRSLLCFAKAASVSHGYVFGKAQEVRASVAKFVRKYNHQWRIERLGFLTPAEARNLALNHKAA